MLAVFPLNEFRCGGIIQESCNRPVPDPVHSRVYGGERHQKPLGCAPTRRPRSVTMVQMSSNVPALIRTPSPVAPGLQQVDVILWKHLKP